MQATMTQEEALVYKKSSKFAMIIFLASEFMLFAALFATYIILRTPNTLPFVSVVAIFLVGTMIVLSQYKTIVTVSVATLCTGLSLYVLNDVTLTNKWMSAEQASSFASLMKLVVINSFILIGSSFTYHAAEGAVAKGKSPVPMLLLTMLLGSIFLGGQVYEWLHMKHEGLWFNTGNQFTTNFFATTGFHGFHVFVGLILIAYVTVKALLGHYNKENHISLQNIGYYWHFVDAIWLVVFCFFYGEHISQLWK